MWGFFSSKYYSTAWSTVGWVCECGAADTGQPWIQGTNCVTHGLSTALEGQCPQSPGGSRVNSIMKELTEKKKIQKVKKTFTLFSSRNFNLTETSLRILSYFSLCAWNRCCDCSIFGRVFASRGPRFSSSKSVRYASYSILERGE